MKSPYSVALLISTHLNYIAKLSFSFFYLYVSFHPFPKLDHLYIYIYLYLPILKSSFLSFIFSLIPPHLPITCFISPSFFSISPSTLHPFLSSLPCLDSTTLNLWPFPLDQISPICHRGINLMTADTQIRSPFSKTSAIFARNTIRCCRPGLATVDSVWVTRAN